MTRYILALLLCIPVAAATIPEQVATKALNGDFGELEEWQRSGYSRLLSRGTTEQVAWITAYWAGEPGVNHTTASGRRTELGRTAAMLEPRYDVFTYGTFVLVSLPRGYSLRQVWDTGSARNLRRAKRRGAETWIDLYMDGPTNWDYVSKIYVGR